MSSKQPRLDGATSVSTSDNGGVAFSSSDDEMEKKPKTMAFPVELPMETPHAKSTFYVRDCYAQYYDKVLGLLDTIPVASVTITGTSGIGKSVFFAYFFNRYQVENKEATIITACFDEESNLLKVVVWKGDKIVDQYKGDPAAMRKLILETQMREERQVKREEWVGMNMLRTKLIFLYDGPPDMLPQNAQMVCFSSPNARWFNKIKKNQCAETVFMPPWTLAELKVAATELKLTLCCGMTIAQKRELGFEPDAEPTFVELIESRFEIFGGVARECLSVAPSFVRRRQDIIDCTINTLRDVTMLRGALREAETCADHDCIFHYTPDPEDGPPTMVELTPYMRRLLVKCLFHVLDEKRVEMIEYLRTVREAAAFRSSLFEICVHEKLNAGCTLTAQRLLEVDQGPEANTTQLETFELKKSLPMYRCYFDNDFSPAVLSSGGPYHVPSSTTVASIDAFYYVKSTSTSIANDSGRPLLLLFQITGSQNHPVNGEGLAKTLKRLCLWQKVKRNTIRVALIFVVPEDKVNSFRFQRIDLNSNGSNIASSDLDLKHTVGSIHQYVWGMDMAGFDNAW